jgi:hypothetical protein
MPAYYLDNIDISSYNEKTLNGFVQDCNERHSLFYTRQGVYTVKNGKLYKINVIHNDVVRRNYKGIEVIIDDSTEELTHITSQIPNDYYVKRIEVVNYKIPGNNHAYLVITYEKDKVIDAFFKSDNDFHSPMLHTTIDTFLSNLN